MALQIKKPNLKITPKIVSDVVGLGVSEEPCDKGLPAVRLTKKGDKLQLVATGYISSIKESLPKNWEEAAKKTSWTLRGEFQAAHVAFAANSSQMSLTQITADSAEETESDGKAHAEAGTRKISQVVNNDNLRLEATIPEFQALWLARKFPEGRHPTACSLQIAYSAALNVILKNPTFLEDGGTACSLFVFDKMTAIAVYLDKQLLVYRENPVGRSQMRNALKSQLGLDGEELTEVLNDTLVDFNSTLQPVLQPLFREVERTLDYASRRSNSSINHIFLYGVNDGLHHWKNILNSQLNRELIAPDLFEGLDIHPSANLELIEKRQDFLPVLGAALAVMEAE